MAGLRAFSRSTRDAPPQSFYARKDTCPARCCGETATREASCVFSIMAQGFENITSLLTYMHASYIIRDRGGTTSIGQSGLTVANCEYYFNDENIRDLTGSRTSKIRGGINQVYKTWMVDQSYANSNTSKDNIARPYICIYTHTQAVCDVCA